MGIGDSITLFLDNMRTTITFARPECALQPFSQGRGLLVCDENTRGLLPQEDTRIRDQYQSAPPGREQELVLPPGEAQKKWDSVAAILERAVETGLDRESEFWGLGGGVICDLTGFAASVYMRGCGLVLVPTTLLAMVDASIGGKTGFDFAGYKNMVGSFYPAREVIIVPEVLASLEQSHFLGGLAEVIKHALLEDRQLLELLEKRNKEVLDRDPQVIAALVERAIRVKVKIVESDFREQGVRAHLNLGHTFAHALESVTGFSVWTHGFAVAWGMDKALKTGLEMGITEPEYVDRVEQLLKSYGFLLHSGEDPEELVRAMHHDKKRRYGEVRHILQPSLCETVIRPVDDKLIAKVLEQYDT
jgi:3-dehydroquinate synthase